MVVRLCLGWLVEHPTGNRVARRIAQIVGTRLPVHFHSPFFIGVTDRKTAEGSHTEFFQSVRRERLVALSSSRRVEALWRDRCVPEA